MAEEESAQERTERASPRRIHEARTKGQVPRSRELTTALMLLASATGMLVLGGQMIRGLEGVFRHGLNIERAKIFQESALIETLANTTFEGMMVIAPFLMLTAVFALLSPLGVGGWVFSTDAFMFNWSRLNPITGLGRVFAWRGLAEMVKALAARGHNVKVWPPFTSAPSILVTPDGLIGAADTRTPGALAAGY